MSYTATAPKQPDSQPVSTIRGYLTPPGGLVESTVSGASVLCSNPVTPLLIACFSTCNTRGMSERVTANCLRRTWRRGEGRSAGFLIRSVGRAIAVLRGLGRPLSTHTRTSRPQGLRREIQAHGPRLEEVLERAGTLASLRSPEAEAVRRGQEQLQGAWAGLREAAERRQQVLDAAFQVEQYYFDVAEVEAWLGEQELLMMSEDKGKVRPGRGCGGPGGAGARGRPLPPHRGRRVPPGRTEHPAAAQEAPAAGAGRGELRGEHRAAVAPVPGAAGDGAPGQVGGREAGGRGEGLGSRGGARS